MRFRLLLASREELAQIASEGERMALEFLEPQAFTAEAARRLSPAVPFNSSLIGVGPSADGWSMWGIVHTGASWLAPTWGGRRKQQPSTSLPLVHVLGAGRLGVYAGSEFVASLENGAVEATTMDVFTSRWLAALFQRARAATPEPTSIPLNDALVRVISQHLVRRAIFLIRQAGHGGLILFADASLLERCAALPSGPLKLKYSFRHNEARGRYRTLLARLAQALAQHGDADIDFQRFLETETREVLAVEQSIFEVSRLIGGLAAVDGAVVLDKRFELVGFGAEVSGELPYPDTVWQALDVEAERRVAEAANSVGTRHRAAYRFVAAHPQGLAIVISHDGLVRFVANLEGSVVYWDQFLNW